MKTLSERVNDLFDKEKWATARKLLLDELKKAPEDHWLLTRIGTTYYEERNYEEALKWVSQALSLAPDCPLVLWDLAGTLSMLGKYKEAGAVYFGLLSRGPQALAEGEHGEGRGWADALMADCLYRLGICFQHMGDADRALLCFERYIRLRAMGAGSIYEVEDATRKISELEKARKGSIESELKRTRKELRPA